MTIIPDNVHENNCINHGYMFSSVFLFQKTRKFDWLFNGNCILDAECNGVSIKQTTTNKFCFQRDTINKLRATILYLGM